MLFTVAIRLFAEDMVSAECRQAGSASLIVSPLPFKERLRLFVVLSAAPRRRSA
jgi:hypothetical protein